MLKKYWKIIVIILLVLIAGIGAYRYYFTPSSEGNNEEIDPGLVMEVQRGDLSKTVNASGYLAPVRERVMSFSRGDRLLELPVEEGDRVEEGDLLARQDQLQEKLNLMQAENKYRRIKIDGSTSQIKEAELSLKLARQELKDTELRAPFSGIITRIQGKVGDYIGAGTMVITIADVEDFKVELDVEEDDSGELEVGQEVKANVGALSEKNLQGKLIEIGQEADINSGIVTLPVTVLLERGEYFIRPGFSVEVDIIVGQVKNKVVIPITAVMSRGGRDVVFKIEDGKAEPVPVETGLTDGTRIVIKEGLKTGEEILTNAAARIEGTADEFSSQGFMPPGGGRMSGGKQ